MKKKLFIGVFALLLCFVLVGCSNKKDEKEKKVVENPQWTADTKGEKVNIPEDAMAAFDTAVKSYKDMELEPVALLATQTVSGTNYMFLCKGTKDNNTSYQVVVVYKDLSNSSRITNVTEFDYAKYSDEELTPKLEKAVGDWKIYVDVGESKLSSELNKIFNDGLKSRYGLNFKPIVFLGTKNLGDANYYSYLVTGHYESNDPVDCIYVMTIFTDDKGTTEITSISLVKLTSFNK